jgi:hypothetical protein
MQFRQPKAVAFRKQKSDLVAYGWIGCVSKMVSN